MSAVFVFVLFHITPTSLPSGTQKGEGVGEEEVHWVVVSGIVVTDAVIAIVALAAVPKRDPVNEDALTFPVIGSPPKKIVLVEGLKYRPDGLLLVDNCSGAFAILFESTNVKCCTVAVIEAVVLIKEDVNAFEDVPNKDPVRPAEALIEDAEVLEDDSVVEYRRPEVAVREGFVKNCDGAVGVLFVGTNVKK